MTKDELKSLASSVSMLKNMIESIVTTVQDRFKDNDKIILSLKEKIENFGNTIDEPSISSDTGQITVSQELLKKIEQMELRLDKLNERILLVEAAKSVKTEIPSAKPVIDISAIEDIAKTEDKTEIVTPKEPAPRSAPPPAPAPAPASPIPKPPTVVDQVQVTDDVELTVPKTEETEKTIPESEKPAELFEEAVNGDKSELLKALKKLEDI